MSREPIAIIGIGCRFPGAKNPVEFWQLLQDGVDAITEVPRSRWDVETFYDPTPGTPGKMNTRLGGFLEQVEQFDPQFFGIAPQEVTGIDPQQRLLLEVVWEALEDAGQIPKHLARTRTGVFIGISSFDYYKLLIGNPINFSIYAPTGNVNCISANRISYVFDFQGPSMAIDTACSSSLVAVHLACQSLWNGESTLALAGGVHVMLSPWVTVSFAQTGLLATDGRCKTFDAQANGYVRSEGLGVVVLKPLSQALTDGDPIYAVIRGSAVNQDGRSNGLTAPNPHAQEAVLREAYRSAVVSPGQVQYVEVHSVGTVLGDSIEIKALGAVLAQERPPGQHCAVGSVKTNIGHLEAAAGIAGLIKVALSLKHRQIPPSLHFREPNPSIHFDKLPLRVQQTLGSWSQGVDPVLAGVSAFGFGGTNAHVVLEEAPIQTPVASEFERPLHILTLSAKSEKALRELAQSYEEFLANHPTALLADICFTANTGRSHFNHCLAVVAASTVQLREQLVDFATGRETAGLVSGKVTSRKHPQIAFLFTGQGSQYVGMGHHLYKTQPTFRSSLDHCDAILRPYLEKPLLEVLYPESGMSSPLNETACTQPALFALEYALAELWKSWGIEPVVVMGHGVGEYVAACVAGVFSLEDGLKLIAERGRLMQALPQGGEMVAVFADEARVVAAIQPYAQEVVIAAFNGPESIVISGKSEAVHSVAASLRQEGIETKKLNVSHAFHSPLMEPMLAAFERVALKVSYSSPRIGLISNVTGGLVKEEIATPEYWLSHVRQPVRFAKSMETLHQQRFEVFVEIGPKPILLGMGHYCLPEEVRIWLPSLRQGHSDWQQLLQSLGELYVGGVPIDWSSFDRDYSRSRLQLPTYPFQRQRYWIETADVGSPKTGKLSKNNALSQMHPLLGQLVHSTALKNKEIQFESQIRQKPQDTFVASRDDLELQLTKIWQEVLGIKSISVTDNLFDLGGDSFLAARMLVQIEKTFQKKLPLAIFFQAPTIGQLAGVLRQQGWPPSSVSLAVIQVGGKKPPLFFFHVLGGGLKFCRPLARHLDPEQPIYGLAVGIMDEVSLNKVEHVVEHYIKEMRIIQPEGPYFLAGIYCGGRIAYEVAEQLHAQGQKVALVALLNTLKDGEAIKIMPIQARLLAHWNNFLQLGPAYLLRKIRKIGIEQAKNRLMSIYCEFYERMRLPLPQACQSFTYRKKKKDGNPEWVFAPKQLYQGRVVLFRAIDEIAFFDSDLGWGKMAPGGLEIHDVPGNNESIFQEPHAQVLAEKLKACLDKAQADEGNVDHS